MAQTFLIFDFGTDEEAAQKARHRIEGWKQAFKLDRKMLVRFERTTPEESEASAAADAGEKKTGRKAKSKAKHADEDRKAADGEKARVLVLVRLDFSDHEKLSHQRWIERLPTDEVFKDATAEVIARGDEDFEGTAQRFEALEAQPGPPSPR